jgi:type VI secretion system Hcp family effector
MKSSGILSTAFAICFSLIECLPAMAQTAAPAAQKFGLPMGQPVMATAPVVAATPAPAASPNPAPGSALAMNNALLAQVKGVGVSIVASKQGTLGKAMMFVDKYQFEPGRDATTAGKVVNGPVTFSKRWDTDSMPLLRALENNEPLTSVTFQLYAVNGNTLYTVTLTNASVASINQSVDSTTGVAMEDVRITYQKIEIQDNTTSPATMVASASY